jgi:DNA-directed RNA polymerase specialized sigma subunit
MSDNLIDRLKRKDVKPRFAESMTQKVLAQLDEIEEALEKGFTGKQIAEELGIEQNLFYSALRRARAKAAKKQADGNKPTDKNQSQKTAPPPSAAAVTTTNQSTQTEEDKDDEFPKIFASKSSAAFANADLPHINKKKDK